MSRFRPRGITVMATLFVVTGLALMLASLRIESGRTTTVDAATADVVVPTVAVAAATADVTATPSSEPSATKLFARAQTANRTLAYGGVKQVTRWTKGQESTVVLTVDHVPGHGTIVAANRAGSTPSAQAATFSIEPAAEDESTMLEALLRNYRLTADQTGTVLGRPAAVLTALRADDSIAARFWIDDATGLVLRRELLASDGSPIENATYLKVDLAPHATGTPTASAAAVWSPVDANGIERLRAAGWTIPSNLSDGLSLYQVREQDGGSTIQLSYTDGLVGISVFQQRGVLDRDAMAGFVPVSAAGGEVWVRTGNLFYTWQSRPSGAPAASDPATAESGAAPASVAAGASATDDGSRDIVVSALVDSAGAPVGAVLTAFPPLPAEEAGVTDHLSRGVQRVGSWIDPLG